MSARDNPLYGVDDVFNAVSVTGDSVGEVMFYGKGAGKLPTASAVVADVLDIVARGDSFAADENIMFAVRCPRLIPTSSPRSARSSTERTLGTPCFCITAGIRQERRKDRLTPLSALCTVGNKILISPIGSIR